MVVENFLLRAVVFEDFIQLTCVLVVVYGVAREKDKDGFITELAFIFSIKLYLYWFVGISTY